MASDFHQVIHVQVYIPYVFTPKFLDFVTVQLNRNKRLKFSQNVGSDYLQVSFKYWSSEVKNLGHQ